MAAKILTRTILVPRDEWKAKEARLLHSALEIVRDRAVSIDKRFYFDETDERRMIAIVDRFSAEILAAFNGARVIDEQREQMRLVVNNAVRS